MSDNFKDKLEDSGIGIVHERPDFDDLEDHEKKAKRPRLEEMAVINNRKVINSLSPEKVSSEDKEIIFKTPEKILTPKISKSKMNQNDGEKESLDSLNPSPIKENKSVDPDNWSLSSELSLYIDGDEDDLISKVEQARRFMVSTANSPRKLNVTPKKLTYPPTDGSRSPFSPVKTPNKGKRVELVTLQSPKTPKKM